MKGNKDHEPGDYDSRTGSRALSPTRDRGTKRSIGYPRRRQRSSSRDHYKNMDFYSKSIASSWGPELTEDLYNKTYQTKSE